MDRKMLVDKIAQVKLFCGEAKVVTTEDTKWFSYQKFFGCYAGILDGSQMGHVDKQLHFHFNWACMLDARFKVILDLDMYMNRAYHKDFVKFLDTSVTEFEMPIDYLVLKIRRMNRGFHANNIRSLRLRKLGNGVIWMDFDTEVEDLLSGKKDYILFKASLHKKEDIRLLRDMVVDFGEGK